ncbi:MAG TPA: WD40 repeat domain-containing protein, partial [Thermoanaerobaculia bacterium]|nr:WD40 repeat domain-containing protein [Thermoanaerobaculia bacterium]
TPVDEIPRRLQRLNFSRLDSPARVAADYPRLLAALRQDALWVREHTRLLELAMRWADAGRPARLLLRGRDIEAGEAWRDSRPPAAPEPSPLHTQYLNASRRHAARLLAAWIAALAAVILVVSALAVSALRQRDEAIAQRLAAESSEGALRSDAVRESAPEEALLDALTAFARKPLPAALAAVRRSIDRTLLLRVRAGAARFPSVGGGRLAQWARSRDGTRIVIGQGPGSLLLLDGETLDETGRLDLPASNPTAIAVSAHARYVASADGSPRALLWTAGSSQKPAEILAPHEVDHIVFGAAERRLALIGQDEITFFSLQPLTRLATASKPGVGAHSLDFAPDDSLAVAVGSGNQAWIIDPATAADRGDFNLKAEATRLRPLLGGSEASMLDRARFLDDGRRVLATGDHFPWSLWDATSGRRLAQAQTLTPGTGTSWSLVQTTLDTVVTEEGTSGRILGWSLSTGAVTHRFGPGHRDLIRTAALSPDGRTVATMGGDRALILWSVAGSRRLGSWRIAGQQVADAAFTPSGNRLVTLTHEGELALWDARAVEELGRLSREGADDSRSFYEPQFSGDGRRLLSFGGSAAVTVWDIERLKPLCVLSLGEVHHAALSEDGRLVATAGADGTLRVWEVATCREVARHAGTFHHLAFDAMAAAVVANHYQGLVLVIAVPGGRLISAGRFSQQLTNASVFTRDGKRYAVLGSDGTAIVAATPTGREVARVRLAGMPFRRGVFAADAVRLLTTHDDNIVRSWDTRTGSLLAQLPGAAGLVTRLRLLAGDRLLLAASHDGTTRLWNVTDGSLVRTFEGSAVEASDAVFAGGRIIVIDSEGQLIAHRCDACLPDDALITRARERLLALGAAGAGSGAVDSRGASR